MSEQQKIKTTNRHIAKLLDRVSILNLPEIAINEIKRQMWFLSDDIYNLCKQGESEK
jgi:hypothetical protein